MIVLLRCSNRAFETILNIHSHPCVCLCTDIISLARPLESPGEGDARVFSHDVQVALFRCTPFPRFNHICAPSVHILQRQQNQQQFALRLEYPPTPTHK